MLEITLQDRCVHITLEHLLNNFERSRVKDAWLVIVSDVQEYKSSSFKGDDREGWCDVKDQQSWKEDHFVFPGTVCFVSNKEMADLFPADEALESRVIPLTFPNPVSEFKTIDAEKDLVIAIPKLILWALTAPDTIFRERVYLQKYDYLVKFIINHFIVADFVAFVSTMNIPKLHGTSIKDNNLPRRPSSKAGVKRNKKRF